MGETSTRGGGPRTIALDGPAASGKSTVGRRLAASLGALFFDTGALYRALAVLALEDGLSPDDGRALGDLARRAHLEVVARPETAAGYAVLAGERDLTSRLWRREVDAIVSAVSAHGAVREALLDAQRRVAAHTPVVMVGRDIGTVVLPEAELKLYLDASLEARARRRYRELLASGEAVTFRDVLDALGRRDARDAGRELAPLAVAPDAVVVSTDRCDAEAVVDHLVDLVRRWPDALTTAGGTADCQERPRG